MNLLVLIYLRDGANFLCALPTSKVPAVKVTPLPANPELKLIDSKLMMGSTPCRDFGAKYSLFTFVQSSHAAQMKCDSAKEVLACYHL